MSDPLDINVQRRSLLLAGSAAVGLTASLTQAASSSALTSIAPAPLDEGRLNADGVTFAPIDANTEAPGAAPPNPDMPGRRVGFAVMGLGRLALQNIIPAFAQSKHAQLRGLVSGNAQKMAAIAAQYGVSKDSLYGYGDIAKLTANKAIDAVYVVLPNALHRDAVLQLAAAGKHVLCEKPMATSPEEARDMVEACKRANRKLMIAYRCQYEVANRELARRARAGELGEIQFIESMNLQNQGDPRQWRDVKALAGGGSLPDVGLYCLNTTRALLGEEPIEVTATIYSPPDDPRFKEVESNVSFVLRFPSGVIAQCASSYSLHRRRTFAVLGSKAHASIAHAFDYQGQRLSISNRDGETEVVRELALGVKNQFALELDHFASCIRSDSQPRTPGEEGLQDQVIMAAIYESAGIGRPVTLNRVDRKDAFRGPDWTTNT